MNNYMKTIISGIKTWARNLKSDWNENDPTADGYIKNRPFYTDDPVETVVVEETTVTTDSNGFIKNYDSFELIEGQNYKVTWNGTVYNAIATYENYIVYIGDGNLLDSEFGNFTGNASYPFAVGSNGIMKASTAGTHTFSVSIIVSEIHKIDQKYLTLPDGAYIGTHGTADGAEVFNDTKSNVASAFCSHAEGYKTKADARYSHAEGYFAKASGEASHSEGNAEANGDYSHAEGHATASGDYSHAEGYFAKASGEASHAEGQFTTASGFASHTEGCSMTATGIASHAEGLKTQASSDYQHVEGKYNIEDTANKYVHIVGNGLRDTKRSNAHTLDWDGNAWYKGTIKVGGTSYDDASEVLSGIVPIISGGTGAITAAEALANLGGMPQTNPTGTGSLSLNRKADTVIGDYSVAEGYNTTASGLYSHAEGSGTTASGVCSHAEGSNTTASKLYSHAEGYNTTASGVYSHAEGNNTTASASSSHAEGSDTTASGVCSHAEGSSTIAKGYSQHVQGNYNIEDANDTYAHIVGNGTADDARSNAHTLDWDGNAWYAGTIKVGGTSYADASEVLSGTVAIANGGTGATTAEGALANLGLTATAIELNYCDGVTSNIQDQLNDRYITSTSRGANSVLAAPDGSDGAATFRSLVANDIPNLAASKITSGTLGVARGGTGKSKHTSNAVLTGNGTSAVKNVATASGAFYATSANGAAKFGTLPIAQGGTGATTAASAISNFGIVDYVVEEGTSSDWRYRKWNNGWFECWRVGYLEVEAGDYTLNDGIYVSNTSVSYTCPITSTDEVKEFATLRPTIDWPAILHIASKPTTTTTCKYTFGCFANPTWLVGWKFYIYRVGTWK